jgi:homoserine O-acetyltransferase
MYLEEKISHFKKPLYLESGRILEPYDIAYTTYGEMNSDKSNVVVITHALTGSHRPVKVDDNKFENGWWDDLIGSGKAVDTDRYFVIATNVIGSIFGSTSPISKIPPSNSKEYRLQFPVITVKDMVKAQHILFQSLGIHRVKAIIGGSMGGMQVLQFGVDFPNFAEHLIPIATTWATQPWAIAFNKVTAEAIKRDPLFNNGEYIREEIESEGLSGLSIGRMAGHISFLSHDSMKSKFGRNYLKNDGYFDLYGSFQVDNYLRYNGDKFSKLFDPLSYLYLTKAINIFDLSNGCGSLSEILQQIRSNLHLISFRGDILFRPEEMREIYEKMNEIGKGDQVSYREVDSNYGHDAFLVEVDKFEDDIRKILES